LIEKERKFIYSELLNFCEKRNIDPVRSIIVPAKYKIYVLQKCNN